MKFTFAQRDEGFDEHIKSSIRGYEDLLDDILRYSDYFIEEGKNVVDVGCSTGRLLKSIMGRNECFSGVNYYGIELEEDFYSGYDSDEKTYPALKYFRGDVKDFKFENCRFVTSVFTLQFLPRALRKEVISKIYMGLDKGGAFLFSEKTDSVNPRIQEIRTFTYYDYKRKYFTTEDIMDKERQLRKMLRPCSRQELIDTCVEVGFSENSIDSFWQNHSFVGFIAVK